MAGVFSIGVCDVAIPRTILAILCLLARVGGRGKARQHRIVDRPKRVNRRGIAATLWPIARRRFGFYWPGKSLADHHARIPVNREK